MTVMPFMLIFQLVFSGGAFTLYEVTGGAKPKAKKLGQGGNPTELELKYGVREKMTA